VKQRETSAVVLFNAEGLIHFLRFGCAFHFVHFVPLSDNRRSVARKKVALDLFIFPIPTSPAGAPQTTVVDFVCALFPFVFELV
jgi:hypothetical protein